MAAGELDQKIDRKMAQKWEMMDEKIKKKKLKIGSSKRLEDLIIEEDSDEDL